MSKRTGALLCLAAALLFLIANRGAYKGYFSDDDLDNLGWTQFVAPADFLLGFATPLFNPDNFRPLGHGLYKAMGAAFGLDFPKYIAVIHALHLVNVWLVWMLARRRGADPAGATLGSLFFAFHMGAFGAVWKPMYQFDVLCALFCLLSIHAFSRGWTVASFAAFWCAYKSKELAVMLPAVLLVIDWKQWKRLLPFFAVSASFGLQGVMKSAARDNAYSFRFTPAALWTTSSFYAVKLMALPLAAIAALRKPAARFGLTMLALFFVPLLPLPGRMFGAYCYLPLAGLAVSAAFLDRRILAAAAIVWIPWNIYLLRGERNTELFESGQRRAYVDALPAVRTAVYDGLPVNFARWGVQGALSLKTGKGAIVRSIEDADVRELLDQPGVAVLNWDGQKLTAVERTADAPFIAMNASTPLWQLGDGWYPLEGRFRWIRPHAWARLAPPPAPRTFQLTVNVGPDMIRETGRIGVAVTLDGKTLGRAEFTRSGFQTVTWPVTTGATRVDFTTDAEYHPANGDPRSLGVPIVSFGFVE